MCDNYEGVWSVSDLENELNPAQLEVIEHLGAPLKDRPSFTSDLKKHLRSALETAAMDAEPGTQHSCASLADRVRKRTRQLLSASAAGSK